MSPARARSRWTPLWLVGLVGALAFWAGVEAIREGLLAAAQNDERERLFLARAIEVQGTVIAHERLPRGTRIPIFRYAAPDGRLIERRYFYRGYRPPEVGELVALLLDPEAPEHPRPKGLSHVDFPWIMFALGAVLIPLGGFAALAFGVLLPWLEWRQRRGKHGTA